MKENNEGKTWWKIMKKIKKKMGERKNLKNKWKIEREIKFKKKEWKRKCVRGKIYSKTYANKSEFDEQNRKAGKAKIKEEWKRYKEIHINKNK